MSWTLLAWLLVLATPFTVCISWIYVTRKLFGKEFWRRYYTPKTVDLCTDFECPLNRYGRCLADTCIKERKPNEDDILSRL